MTTAYLPSQLASSTLAFVGKSLFCKPVYGWGWSYFDDCPPGTVPEPFHFHLVELFKWNGVLRGGFGIVAEIEHRYHGNWVTFYTRGSKVYDLYNGYDFSCNVSFFTEKPNLRPAEEYPEWAANWPLLDIATNPKDRLEHHLAFGFGDIAANEDVLLERDTMRKMQFTPLKILPPEPPTDPAQRDG